MTTFLKTSRAILGILFFTLISCHLSGKDSIRVNEVFLNTPLIDVVELFNSKYGVLIAFEKEDVQDLFVHRYVLNLTLPDALKDVLENSGLEYQFTDENEILIRRNKHLMDAPYVVLEGRISDPSSKAPLIWATIYDNDSKRAAYTDDQGHFKLKINNPPPSGILNVSYMGYEDQVVVWSHKDKSLDIKLQPTSHELMEVTVVDRLPTKNPKRIDGGFRKKHKIQNISLASPGMKDAIRELQLMPGVSATNDLSAGLKVRGGDESNNLYLLDGIEFFNINHFYGIFSAFDPNTVDTTSLYLYNFPIKYGGRTSAVVDMRLREPAGADLNGQIGIHTIYSLFNIESKITENSGILFSTRFTNGDISDQDIYDVIFDDSKSSNTELAARERLNEVVPFFRFNDAQLKWQWKPTTRSSISATFFRGRDMSNTSYLLSYNGRFQNLRSIFTDSYDETTHWDNTGINLSYDQTVSDKWSFEFDVSGNEYVLNQSVNTKLKVENIITRDSLELVNNVNNTVAGFAIKWNNKFRLIEGHLLEAGIDVESHRTGSSAMKDDSTLFDRRDTAYNLALYTSYSFPISPKVDVKFGVRMNSYSPTSELYLSPRASIKYAPTNKLWFELSGGVYNQFLRSLTYEDRFGTAHDVWLLADNTHSILKSNHLNFATGFRKSNFLTTIDFYLKDSENELIQLWLINGFNANTNSPNAKAFRTFNCDGRAIGMNIYSQYHKNWYTGSLTYTLSKNTISTRGISEGDPFPASNDRRHELSLLNQFSIGNWTIANTVVYGSGYPYVSAVLVQNRDIRNLEVDERIERLEDYIRVDLAVEYNFKLWRQNFSAGLSVFNLFDRKNNDQVQYLFNLNQQSGSNDDYIIGSEINLLPRTLDLSLEWHF